MGLDTTHDCFHGAYSAFNRLRKAVARACGGSFPPHLPDYDAAFLAREPCPDRDMWYFEDEVVPPEHLDGMRAFLGHSDCDGILTPTDAALVEAFLRWASPLVETGGGGHIARGGGARAMAEQFAAGCEVAVAAGEPVEFR